MKLIGSDGSPYARKVRLVLEEKHIPHEYVVDRPSAPGSRVPEFNPLGKIPVLVLDDGRTIYDSPVIVEYLDGLASEPRLIPAALDERIDVKRWEALGDGIVDASVAVSHDYRKAKERRESEEWYHKQRQKIARGLTVMAGHLGERAFCHRDRFSLADIAAGYALSYLDHAVPDIDWRTQHPNLKRLADQLAQRDSFRKTPHPKT